MTFKLRTDVNAGLGILFGKQLLFFDLLLEAHLAVFILDMLHLFS
jgi:hypothetical protein